MHKLYDLPWTDTLNRTKNVVTSLAIYNCDEKWRIIILLKQFTFFYTAGVRVRFPMYPDDQRIALAFKWQSCGILSLGAERGWRVKSSSLYHDEAGLALHRCLQSRRNGWFNVY